ncbi:MAG: hypothetical protein IT204_14835 [Fimbriimonadaceae bacterium]|nr:hypothetical protein [Fimbriimonadaceae bacterium]
MALRRTWWIVLLAWPLLAAPGAVVPDPRPAYTYLVPSQLPGPPITLHWLVLVYTRLDLPASPARGHQRLIEDLEPEVVERVVNLVRTFEAHTARYTGGEVGYSLAVVVLPPERPLTGLRWVPSSRRYGAFRVGDIERELEASAGRRTGWFDNVHLFFPFSGPFRPNAAWGGIVTRDDMSGSQQSISQERGFSGDNYSTVWHEGIHGLELQLWRELRAERGCRPDLDFDGLPLELHGPDAFGYARTVQQHSENYQQWLGDVLTGQIRDLRAVGPAGYATAPVLERGFGRSGMYFHGPVRREYPTAPGGPFE